MTDQIIPTEPSGLSGDTTTTNSSLTNIPNIESSQEQQRQEEEEEEGGGGEQPESSTSSSSSSVIQACTNCHTQSDPAKPLKPCLKCHSAHYCSRDCQKADLKQHKKVCAAAAQVYAQTADLKPVTHRAPPKEGYQKGLRKWQFDT